MENFTKNETQGLAKIEAYAMLTHTPFDLTTYLKPLTGVQGSGDQYMTARSLVTLVAQLLEIVNGLGSEEDTMPLLLTANGGQYAVPFDSGRDTISRIVSRIRQEL
jgi:hypothetical protein